MYIGDVGVMNQDTKKLALHFILWSMGALVVCYVLFLGNMVSNIVERRALETRARSLSSEVGDLELTYLTLSNNIDLAFSRSLGFKEAKTTFATRKSLGLGNTSRPFENIKATQNDL